VGRYIPFLKASRPLKSAEIIIQLTSWCINAGGNLAKFMSDLIESRTNVPKEVLQATAGIIVGGSVTHRLDDHVTKRGTLCNFRSNITTNVYFTSDEMGRFSRGNENYKLHFQGAIHLGFVLCQTKVLSHCDVRKMVLHLHYTGTCCEEKL
jgi:mRNA capping enzyme